jgi:magnesium chelatase subunit D
MEDLIRAAAPGRRRTFLSSTNTGRVVGSRPFSGTSLREVAFLPTLKAACGRPGFDRFRRPVGFSREDLRQKIKRERVGYSIVFVVDASSSMGGQGRMSLVKGLLNAYLKECYLRRDRVALVAFRHQQSQVIQPFTGNLGQVQRSLRQLPVGGKTPLAEGLRLGFRALAQEHFKYPRSAQVLVLVSDGKPNLSFSGLDPVDEAFYTAAWLGRNGITFVFIDTEPNPLAFGYGPAIARKAGGAYRTLVDLLKRPVS